MTLPILSANINNCKNIKKYVSCDQSGNMIISVILKTATLSELKNIGKGISQQIIPYMLFKGD
jgi:hypothetical protein